MQGEYKDIGNFGNTDMGEGSGFHLKSHDLRICGLPWVKDEWEISAGYRILRLFIWTLWKGGIRGLK